MPITGKVNHGTTDGWLWDSRKVKRVTYLCGLGLKPLRHCFVKQNVGAPLWAATLCWRSCYSYLTSDVSSGRRLHLFSHLVLKIAHVVVVGCCGETPERHHV